MSDICTKWERLPPMTTGRVGCAVAVINKKTGAICVAGGSEDGFDSMERYNIDSNQWDQEMEVSEMNQERYGYATAVLGNDIYVAGGKSIEYNRTVNTVEVFNIKEDTWTTLPPMNTERFGSAAVFVDDEFFFMLGGVGRRSYLDTAEVYNMKTGEWTHVPPMSTPRCLGSAGDRASCAIQRLVKY